MKKGGEGGGRRRKNLGTKTEKNYKANDINNVKRSIA